MLTSPIAKPKMTKGVTCTQRAKLIGFRRSHKIKTNAAGSVHAVVLLKSASTKNNSAAT